MCVCTLSCSVMSDSLQPHGLQPSRLLCPWGFSRQEYWSELPCPPPGDFPNPGIEPRSPALQADSLLPEPPGKPKNTGVGSLSLLQGIFPTQESTRGLLHCKWILYHLCLILCFSLKFLLILLCVRKRVKAACQHFLPSHSLSSCCFPFQPYFTTSCFTP